MPIGAVARGAVLPFTFEMIRGEGDSRLARIFRNAVEGKGHVDITRNVSEGGGDFRTDGHRRGNLYECRCKVLDRMRNPKIRIDFEDQVIDAAVKLVRENGLNRLRLGMFCTGRLLGEEILLFRLLDALKKSGFQGDLELFLIDRDYGSAVRSGGFEDYMQQFLVEVGASCPDGISVNGAFFADSSEYIARAKEDRQFEHDLLIGADIETARPFMGQIGREASSSIAPKPITLLKAGQIPKVCKLKADGALEGCFVAGKKEEKGGVDPFVYVVVGVALVALIGFMMMRRR